MMKFLFDKFAEYAMLRAVVFAVMGILTLMFSGFLLGTVFYVIVGYVLLCGIWCAADYVFWSKETKAPVRYGNLVAAVLMIAFGVFSVIYGSYLVHAAPLYLGALMLVNGFIYFIVALCAKTGMKWLLILLSIFVLIGGCAIFIFTFGFRIVLTLAQVSCITLLLSCSYELVVSLIYRKSNNGHMEREEMK